MRMMHLADLHIGKVVNGYSMLEEQQTVLRQVTDILRRENIHHLILAGDIYDTPQPTQAAIELYDQWLNELRAAAVRLYIISGNHDSMRRLSFGEQSFHKNEIEIAPYFEGKLKTVRVEEDGVCVFITLLPFLKPAMVRPYFPDQAIDSYEEAIRVTLAANPPVGEGFHLCVAHQFVTGGRVCESEELVVGGTENISAELFAAYDYVALGHLHEAQSVGGRAVVRYAGSPLKYSFSEVNHRKSATILEWSREGVQISTRDLQPTHDLVEVRGIFNEVIERRLPDPSAYLHVVLCDETEVPQALQRLRSVFPNIMKLDYERRRWDEQEIETFGQRMTEIDELELFGRLYQMQMGRDMSERQLQILKELLEEESE